MPGVDARLGDYEPATCHRDAGDSTRRVPAPDGVTRNLSFAGGGRGKRLSRAAFRQGLVEGDRLRPEGAR